MRSHPAGSIFVRAALAAVAAVAAAAAAAAAAVHHHSTPEIERVRMPLVDYDNESSNINSTASEQSSALEPKHGSRYIQPACPARARRKPNPDLVVLYKLQQAEQQRRRVVGSQPHGAETPVNSPSKPAAKLWIGEAEQSGPNKHDRSDVLGSENETNAAPQAKRRRRARQKPRPQPHENDMN